MDEIFIENIRLKEQIATIERMLKKINRRHNKY